MSDSIQQHDLTVTRAMLEGRTARCCDKNSRPSVEALEERLAFFEYRGPGSEVSQEQCQVCGFYQVAHTKEGMARNVPTNRRTVIEQGHCTGFVAYGPFDTDRYYCGCRGWD